MQPIEEFMRMYFSARTAAIHKECERHKALTQIYFSPDCLWESHEGLKEQSESETIESVSLSGVETQVITRRDHFIPHLRYSLQQLNNSWLIHCVEVQCFECKGQSSYQLCERCAGTGWLDPSKLTSTNPRRSNPPSNKRF